MEPISLQNVEKRILIIRGHRVMVDSDLAVLYGVKVWNLTRAVDRNMDRFPADFAFRLSSDEAESLKRHFGVSKIEGRGGRRSVPYVFTEEGVAMLSSVLRGERAVQVNVAIMRAFVKLREMVSAHRDLAQRLDELEKKYNRRFKIVFEAIRGLMEPSVPPKPRIGFQTKRVEVKS